MDEPIEKFEMWARVDLFGHNQRVGKLSVTNTGVEILYRLDIPTPDGFKTEFYGKGAVYSILPVSEDAARLIAQKLGPVAPISQWDLPEQWREAMRVAQAKALPAPQRGSVVHDDFGASNDPEMFDEPTDDDGGDDDEREE